ncbi:MAG TPA: phosphodiester glycosidase family protein [Patescibacteria group bacterium]|nr:phosphodiester glycosidase family protein [Patescibacteria group bacterium]
MVKKNGFILPTVAIVLILAIIAFVLYQRFGLKIPVNLPIASPSPTSGITPSPSPTVAPTKSPTPKPVSTATGTPKPTTAPVSGPPGAGYSTITVATEKGNFSASVLSIDLNSARMITDTGNDGDCGNDCTVISLQDYVNRNGGFAGVNGTYFCPPDYADCASKKNSYDFSVYNTRLGHWINQGMLSWGSRAIFYFDGGGAHYQQNSAGFGGSLTAGIVNYPGLISGGVVQIDDAQSGLSDKQKAKGTKVGIGMRNEKNIMIVIGRNVTMQEFAYVFKALSATGALNLDDGGSTALYYNGRYLAGPGRLLPNAVIFAR